MPARCPDSVLLFIDVPPGRYAGYAQYGGIARVSLPAVGGGLSDGQFQALVAHELGHSILHIEHTDAASGANCTDDRWALMRSGVICPLPAGAGILDFEITCQERLKLGWPCKGGAPDELVLHYAETLDWTLESSKDDLFGLLEDAEKALREDVPGQDKRDRFNACFSAVMAVGEMEFMGDVNFERMADIQADYPAHSLFDDGFTEGHYRDLAAQWREAANYLESQRTWCEREFPILYGE